MVSVVAAIPAVRTFLVDQQRKLGEAGNVIMDGRDIGTNVFRDAVLKVFMTASVGKRTERRYLELKEKGDEPSINEIRENLIQRDHIDSTRADNPLRQAEDALLLDTSDHTLKTQVDFIVTAYKKAIALEV
jgi:cytidylate kinase